MFTSKNYHFSHNSITEKDAQKIKFSDIIIDGFCDWKVCDLSHYEIMVNSKDFPGKIKNCNSVYMNVDTIIDNNGHIEAIFTDSRYPNHNSFYNSATEGNMILYSECLYTDKEYEQKFSVNNPMYTENERIQFTLDLFIQNELVPNFDNKKITKLYKKIYLEKRTLLKQLQKTQTQIEETQKITLLSSEFDYTALLAKYDVQAINNSIIKYYQAVQNWCADLMEKLDYYEKEKFSVINKFNVISLELSKKYKAGPDLTEDENALFRDRQRFFQKSFSLEMNSIKSKILAVKKQADDLEYKIDEIDNGINPIYELAELEQEKRASFSFLAENTAKIIKNALLKIEYFENNNSFVMNSVNIWDSWTKNYKSFKTTYKNEFQHDCENDGIEEEIWSDWYKAWQQLRYTIELKIQPVIERGLRGYMPTNIESETSVPEQLIAVLDEYKNNVDKFYKEERKGIYQKFVFQSGGELQDKFETESSLYKYAAMFQSSLQNIIFNCKNAEDRVWILNWANSLLDIQIDEILTFVADNDLQKISHTILDEFASLKQKNYDIYLADAKAYSEEKAHREKEYNSLIFKMRKDLMKQ